MKTITKIIKKVTRKAQRAVLLGALVGGASILSYATETTAGPTIEKAQLEAVTINLEAVVAAISKADPNWVKGLQMASVKVKRLVTADFTLIDTDRLAPESYQHASSTPPCQQGVAEICYITTEVENPEDPEEDWRPVMTDNLQSEIETIFDTPPALRQDTQNVKLRAN